jgi:NitT/TauT family transport system substrate-binding protein
MKGNEVAREPAVPAVMTRRRILTTATTGISAVTAASCLPRPALSQAVKVRYTLSWLPTGQYAFIYSARQLGYLTKRGIDLEISRGFGSLAAIQAVSTGQFDMGGAQTGAILLSIIKGSNLRLPATQGYDATPRDLADFQSRHGEAPRFAGKLHLVDAGWDDTKAVP